MRIIYFLFILLTFSAFAEQDRLRYLNTKYSSFDWKNLDHKEWVDFKEWKRGRLIRDDHKDWRVRLQESELIELMGKVLQCSGSCLIQRGLGRIKANFRNSIREGDEFVTLKDSYAWVLLLDGTLVRLSPETSISFREINIGANKIFLHARINDGNALWLNRNPSVVKEHKKRETDTLFLPLQYYQANPPDEKIALTTDEWFQYINGEKYNLAQYKRLNRLIEENNQLMRNRTSYTFLVMPNGNIEGEFLSLEAYVLMGNRSFIMNRSKDFYYNDAKEESDTLYYYRGFKPRAPFVVKPGIWYEVDTRGREIAPYENPQQLAFGEFVTSRIPSVMVARELLLREYSLFLFEKNLNPSLLSSLYGYRLWGKLFDDEKSDLTRRVEFIRGHSTRVETYNLVSSGKYFRVSNDDYYSNLKKKSLDNRFHARAMRNFYRTGKMTIGSEDGKTALHSTTRKLWKRLYGQAQKIPAHLSESKP